MTLNQPPWPRQWLMTDQRIGERLWPLLEQLPVGSGIVLRHDRLPAAERARMADRVAAIARERELVLGVAGDVDLAHRVGAALIHRPTGDPRGLPVSWPVHDEPEADRARLAGAALVFVSPVFATAPHPSMPPLGPVRARLLAACAGVTAIAMGGMDAARFATVGAPFHGWAGIDSWIGQSPA